MIKIIKVAFSIVIILFSSICLLYGLLYKTVNNPELNWILLIIDIPTGKKGLLAYTMVIAGVSSILYNLKSILDEFS